jgi:glycosyltransferase involved in cell wall biosynthesis
MKNVLIVRYGTCDHYTKDIAELLFKNKVNVTVIIIADDDKNRPVAYENNFLTLKALVECHLIIPRKTKINYLLKRTSAVLNRVGLGYRRLWVPYGTAKSINSILGKNTNKFDFIFCIERMSLLITHLTFKSCMDKIIYYSLEIYTKENPMMINATFRDLVSFEHKSLAIVNTIIIQDELRAKAFFADSFKKLEKNIFYLPVSINEPKISSAGNYYYKNYKVDKEKKILLYYGSLYKDRGVENLIEAFKKINRNGDYVLVLHGFLRDAKIPNNDKSIILSTNYLNFEDVYKIISSAHVGLAFYGNEDLNNRLTAFSSEKVARYTQCGIPYIALRNESYIKLQNEFKCCELIDSFSDIKSCLDKIEKNYESYRANAYKAFDKYFNFKNASKNLIQFIER